MYRMVPTKRKCGRTGMPMTGVSLRSEGPGPGWIPPSTLKSHQPSEYPHSASIWFDSDAVWPTIVYLAPSIFQFQVGECRQGKPPNKLWWFIRNQPKFAPCMGREKNTLFEFNHIKNILYTHLHYRPARGPLGNGRKQTLIGEHGQNRNITF